MILDNKVQLFEISYVSKATQEIGLSGLIHLFTVCQKKNKKNDLTGVLFFENGHFAQILEGEREIILKTWDTISSDPRHEVLRKISFKEIDQRLFPNWGLRFYGAEKIAQDLPQLTKVLDGLESHDSELLEIMRSVSLNN
jgi:lipopolysaccharide export LptBFGC system permease protein LptF